MLEKNVACSCGIEALCRRLQAWTGIMAFLYREPVKGISLDTFQGGNLCGTRRQHETVTSPIKKIASSVTVLEGSQKRGRRFEKLETWPKIAMTRAQVDLAGEQRQLSSKSSAIHHQSTQDSPRAPMNCQRSLAHLLHRHCLTIPWVALKVNCLVSAGNAFQKPIDSARLTLDVHRHKISFPPRVLKKGKPLC
jgi:hypothetical protein